MVEIYNHQDRMVLSARFLQEVTSFLELEMQKLKQESEGRPLVHIELLEVNIVDDSAITQIHADFLGDPTPTDVITFDHGEIFVSVDTAQRVCDQYGNKFETELLTYMVHGMLHLADFDDVTPGLAEAMHQKQDEIVKGFELGE